MSARVIPDQQYSFLSAGELSRPDLIFRVDPSDGQPFPINQPWRQCYFPVSPHFPLGDDVSVIFRV